MYAVFASGGFITPAKSVLAVMDGDGQPLSRYPIRVESAVELRHAATLSRALQVAMTHGTGKRSPLADSGAAGKTGTSSDYRDSWFAAYGANLLSVVWIGRDDGASHRLSGTAGAMRVWGEFGASLDIQPALAAPDNAIVDYETGLLAAFGCGNVRPADPGPLDTAPQAGLPDPLKAEAVGPSLRGQHIGEVLQGHDNGFVGMGEGFVEVVKGSEGSFRGAFRGDLDRRGHTALLDHEIDFALLAPVKDVAMAFLEFHEGGALEAFWSRPVRVTETRRRPVSTGSTCCCAATACVSE